MRCEPIIVVGPGRCGTSAMAKRLIDSGVFMGYDFVPGDANSPGGYWEDTAFVQLNEARRKSHIQPSDWAARVRSLADVRYEQAYPWGWKDPRTADFIEDTVRLFPKALYIRCRRPADKIVSSLQRCYGMSRLAAQALLTRRELALDSFLPKPYLEHWIDKP